MKINLRAQPFYIFADTTFGVHQIILRYSGIHQSIFDVTANTLQMWPIQWENDSSSSALFKGMNIFICSPNFMNPQGFSNFINRMYNYEPIEWDVLFLEHNPDKPDLFSQLNPHYPIVVMNSVKHLMTIDSVSLRKKKFDRFKNKLKGVVCHLSTLFQKR